MAAGASLSEGEEGVVGGDGGGSNSETMRRDASGTGLDAGGSAVAAGAGPSAGLPLSSSPPLAGEGAVHLAHLVLGVGSLTPFNALINAAVFFRARLGATPYAAAFGSAFPLAFTGSNVGALALALVWRRKRRASGLARASLRVDASLGVCALVFCVLGIQALDPGATPALVFWTTVGAAAVLGGCCAFFSAAVVGLASRFPGGTCTQAVMAGQGVAGLGIALMALCSDAASHASSGDGDVGYAQVRNGALGYFAVTLCVVIACREAFRRMLATPYAKDVLGDSGEAAVEAPLLDSEAAVDVQEEGEEEEVEEEDDASGVTYRKLAWSIRWPEGAVFGVFAVTLAVFPATTALVAPVPGTEGALARPGLFVNLGFVVFNAGDLLGRVLAKADGVDWERAFGERIRLAGYAALRLPLVPLLAACHVRCPGSPSASGGGFLAASNAPFFVLLSVLGTSNGMLSSRAMMLGPGMAKRLWGGDHSKEKGGELMVLFLTLGLAAGSLVSFLVSAAVC